MRYHTKEYYRLMMGLGAADAYEPVIDKESYTEEDIEELYREAKDRYIEDERVEHDTPPSMQLFDEEELENFDPENYIFYTPELFIDAQEGEELVPRHPADADELRRLQDQINVMALEAYENRPPFDEEESGADFEEMYRDSLDEPDEDLPDWVREAVDPRMLAMGLMPEKIYRRLMTEDEANETLFEALDDAADEALEALRESLPEKYQEFTDILEDLEDSTVVSLEMEKGFFSEDDAEPWLEILMVDWSDEGKEVPRTLKFIEPEITEDDGLEVEAWEDEDGDTESDCEFLYGELYLEDGKPEFHMLFDNKGLKYLTLRCSEAVAEYGWNNERCRIGKVK